MPLEIDFGGFLRVSWERVSVQGGVINQKLETRTKGRQAHVCVSYVSVASLLYLTKRSLVQRFTTSTRTNSVWSEENSLLQWIEDYSLWVWGWRLIWDNASVLGLAM